MQKRIFGCLAVVLCAGGGPSVGSPQMRPAEEPPGDFSALQYIDSAGCVFTRDGKLWTVRRGRDGAPVCGYPPTPVARVSSPPPAKGTALHGMDRIEAELVSAVTAHMAPGDLQTDVAGIRRHASAAAESDPDGIDEDVRGAILASMAVQPAVERTATAALPHFNPRLCALLGIDPGRPAQALIGDPTGGYCGGSTAPALAPRISRVERAARNAGVSAAPVVVGPSEPRVTIAGRSRPTPPALGSGSATPTGGRVSKALPPVVTRPQDGLIPAGTRFLEVGTYSEERIAEAVLGEIARLGLPAARSRGSDKAGTLVVLAGPFADRQTVVRAHDKLRRAGFLHLRPRR